MQYRIERFLPVVMLCALFLVGSTVHAASSSLIPAEPSSTPKQFADHMKLSFTQDAATERLIFKRDAAQIVLCPGMYHALVNGRRVKLNKAVYYENGELRIPDSILTTVQKNLDNGTAMVTIPTIKQADPVVLGTTPKAYRGLKLVMLDAGHGGQDQGTSNAKLGILEKDVTLSVVKKMKAILEKQGIEVVLTRADDTFLELSERARLANKYQPDLFISIHMNSVANPKKDSAAHGFEVYIDSEKKYTSREKARLAAEKTDILAERFGSQGAPDENTENILYRLIIEQNLRESNDVAGRMLKHLEKSTGDINRGLKRENFHVLRETFVPSVLIECGFLSNDTWAKKLGSDSYQDTLARALCQAVLDYKTQLEADMK